MIKKYRQMYRNKAYIVEAVQYSGEVTQELCDWICGDKSEGEVVRWPNVLLIRQESEVEKKVWIGEWIVKSENGWIQIVSNLDFELRYSEAKEEEKPQVFKPIKFNSPIKDSDKITIQTEIEPDVWVDVAPSPKNPDSKH